jgi:hypothetical protein
MSFSSTRSSVVAPLRCPCAPVLPIEWRPRLGCPCPGPYCCCAFAPWLPAGCVPAVIAGSCAAVCCTGAGGAVLVNGAATAAVGLTLVPVSVPTAFASAGFASAALASPAFASVPDLREPSAARPFTRDSAALTRLTALSGLASLAFSSAASAGFPSPACTTLPSLLASCGFSLGLPSVVAAGFTACS